jgi:diguanylate cyclase
MSFFEKLGLKTDAEPLDPPLPAVVAESWGHAARRDLLEQITDFMLVHDLPVTPANLTTAHAVLSGSDLALARKVAERQLAGEQVTEQWLDSIAPPPADSAAERSRLERLMEHVEAALAGLARSTDDARQNTGAAETQIRRHVVEIEGGGSGLSPDQLMQLSRAMLATLQRIERDMQRSQDETLRLQQQLDKARAEADHDHLTGLPNRRAFEQALTRFCDDTDQAPLFVAICDVDHFKRINDSFGHETGDRLLRAIAGVLQRFASEDCFVARHGGEEFVILLRGHDMAGAVARLEAAREELAGRKFVARRDNRAIGQVTLSAGVADVRASANPRDALAAADAALYRAKEAGRNCIVAA